MRRHLHFPCNSPNSVLLCEWCCQQHSGRRFPLIYSGVIYFLISPDRKRGGDGMVTWEGIFQFCILIATVIALVIQAYNNKR